MTGEVQKNIGSIIQKYTEEANREDDKVEAKLPIKPYLVDTRVGYKGGSSTDLPPMFKFGGAAAN